MKYFYFLFGLLLWPHLAAANPTEFSLWLAGVRQEASQRGISPGTIEQSLNSLAPLEWVIEQDRKQMARPGGKKVTGYFSRYIKRVLPQQKINRAREHYRDYSPLLSQIEQRYGVPGHYLVALWGIESHFGDLQGKTPVIQALATLAYDGRRGDFFREELFQALRILDLGHISPGGMIGSWAGAMGQVQFMPSSFAAYAVDFDGDGRKDIWNSEADALASAARYLIANGWRPGEGWGEKVTLPKGFNQRLVGLETRKSLGEWRRLGIRDIDGSNHREASLILPDGTRSPAFLVFDNFRVLLKWNRSNAFALTVGHLAHRLYGENQKKNVGNPRS